MSDVRLQLGNRGEDLALAFLTNLGYQLICRNYRFRGGELDLVMRDAGILVFVEVRTKSALAHGSPLETVNYKKRRQIEKTARYYLAREKISDDIICRFDVVGISIPPGQSPVIEHIPNAFLAGE